MSTRLDHIVVAASSLEQGVDYIKKELGVAIPKGGEHPQMGTHNCVMNIGEGLFFEVIAVNPNAKPPKRPRWFSLDDPAVQRSIAHQPRLLTWLVNTENFAALQMQASYSLGHPTALSRDHLRWLFGIPDDGALLGAGLLPYVLQWQTETHPAHAMADLGCRFKRLTVHHPYPSWITEALDSIGADDLVTVEALPENRLPYFSVHMDTPLGERVLDSQIA